ncbi:KamA family radical SAM protein [Bacteroidota bacterium]
MEYTTYTLRNFKDIPQLKSVSREKLFDIEVVGSVLPFKTNNYVVEKLIDWDNYTEDPIFCLNFPQRDMLSHPHFESIAQLICSGADKSEITKKADEIRLDLNPHPAGQLEYNVPEFQGELLPGAQHKYKETLLFFPSQGQTCHAYCTFCFRWPQFTGMSHLKFAMNQTDLLIGYLSEHPEITDLLFTGGDPMVMSAKNFEAYIDAVLEADLKHLKNIRIGTKTLAFWPYRYVADPDAADLLKVFKKIVDRGKHLAFMAHFSHPVELSTDIVKEAVKRIRETGAEIRTQSPIMNHINADPDVWAKMWTQQVSLGMIPYYMFIARDTGAKDYFSIPLVDTWRIFRQAYGKVSGISRTVRGPSMSANPGKVHIVGVTEVKGQKVFVLNFLQARNKKWVGRPFFAAYDEHAEWLTDLKPAFGETEFFYSSEFRKMLNIDEDSMGVFTEELNRFFSRCSGDL